VRLLVAALALATAVWLAVELRSSTAQQEMIELAFTEQTPTRTALARAQELAPRARTLNPDVRVEETLGVLELRTGDRAAAVATFHALTRREPRNPELWAALARAAAGYDEALATGARERLRSLVPPLN
jgi:predicted Zn-dependent protease